MNEAKTIILTLLYKIELSNSPSFVFADAEIVWCQEEPMNMGAYTYVNPRLYTAMRPLGRGSLEDIKYIGRAPSAATATGFYTVHVQEQTDIVKKALQPEPISYPY